MFQNAADFPFVKTLEANWRTVLREFLQLESEHFGDWPEKALYGEGWKTFGFYFLGRRLPRGAELCPETARLVDTIPGMVSAGFSMLQPKTNIRPHVGYSDALLVAHLGLVIPEGCAIRVGPETRTWQPGKMIVFDDSTDHEAWNHGSTRRCVLLIEFVKPGRELAEVTMSQELAASVDGLG